MYDFIEGILVEKTPAFVVLNNNGIGYHIHISLFTFSSLPENGTIKLFIHNVVREDANILFGYATKREREIFRHLISVSGIGANTARIILSSLNPDEVVHAILQAEVSVLQSIKGIGGKTAQRIIVDLKDKIGKGVDAGELFSEERNTIRDESLSALVALGFPKKQVEKVIKNILSQNSELSVEEVVKQALKLL